MLLYIAVSGVSVSTVREEEGPSYRLGFALKHYDDLPQCHDSQK